MRIRCSATRVVYAFVAVVFAVGVAAVQPTRGQAPAQTFEVTSVKPAPPGGRGVGVRFLPNGRFSATNISLRDLIATAYGTPQPVPTARILGGPDWIASDRFDVDAVAGGPILADPTFDGLPRPMFGMLQALLAERFQLNIRRENRELPVYALVRAKPGELGPRLRRSENGCAAMRALRAAGPDAVAAFGSPQPSCGLKFTRGVIAAQGMPIEEIVRAALSRYVDRTVIDNTELTGEYDLDLEWSPDSPAGSGPDAAAPPPGDGASLFTAVREQLGLRLEAQRAPLEVFVVESAQRPAAN